MTALKADKTVSDLAGALLVGYGPCKTAFQTVVKTEAGSYQLSGWVRTVNVRPDKWGWTILVSFEPSGKEFLTPLPGSTYGWRKFPPGGWRSRIHLLRPADGRPIEGAPA